MLHDPYRGFRPLLTVAAALGLGFAAAPGLAAPPAPASRTADAIPDPAAPVDVELELALLVDSSDSIDPNEYALQVEGYAAAFRDPEVQAAALGVDGIAVRYVLWASYDQQMTFGWMRLETANDCLRFADRIEAMGRPYAGGTLMARALDEALHDLANNNIHSRRQVIDVSGDGIDTGYKVVERYGDAFFALDPTDRDAIGRFYDDVAFGDRSFFPMSRAAFVDEVAACGPEETYRNHFGRHWQDVTADLPATGYLNGISIGPAPHLQRWYEDVLPRGDGAFAMNAPDFTAFGEAIKRKLIREISEVPTAVAYD